MQLLVQMFESSMACPERNEGSFYYGGRSFEAQDARSAHLELLNIEP
jgi:hypothetical protein